MPDRHRQRDCAAAAESKNIGLIYMEILEQRSRVLLFEAERPVCNVCGVAVSLLLKSDHLPVAREFRQHMAERGLYRVSAAMKQHKRRVRRTRGSMNLVINSEAINRRVALLTSISSSLLVEAALRQLAQSS
jgi:predicted regulator of Ras-like GTPase activity (Roadblock/LC7/MglB family)